jgi:hypothetical protein
MPTGLANISTFFLRMREESATTGWPPKFREPDHDNPDRASMKNQENSVDRRQSSTFGTPRLTFGATEQLTEKSGASAYSILHTDHP